ncbi:MAG: acetyl-CoA carboxylase biotin carboxylase subunit [Labilithrix sp.]|nr:acetyl-CoA carboxylase biotin carboxylase subunit [Labilithrix sp.]
MSARRFTRVLVANRGEIAVRVLRGARRAGYETVAVYSDADASALHVREADRAVRLGPAPSAESYASIERILEAARASGADAIHPGYGFLSERAAFAQAVVEAGLVFIGPAASSIEAMGDKSAAKARMLAAGVPCIPGFHGRSDDEQTEERLLAEARAIGFPLMIKAAAGGGGRGMRLVESGADDAVAQALTAARSEAKSAFGDGTLLLERALLGARHVEVQVFGDRHGGLVHFGERDCSIQRRNQKVVEECPSPAVGEALRARMGETAVRAARAVDYVGAGTVELMLVPGAEPGTGELFFLEMNTRLQVEHPVTELVYDVDLVDLQLRVAQGERLPWSQAEIDARRSGHAIEVRLCAEDAAFRPRTGTVLRYEAPGGSGVRVDAGIETGTVVSPHYDSMLGKIIAHGKDREDARRRLLGALGATVVLGVETNRDVLRDIVGSEAFASGRFDTQFLAKHVAAPEADLAWHRALAVVALEVDDAERLRRRSGLPASLLGFSSNESAPSPYALLAGDTKHVAKLVRGGGSSFVVTAAGVAATAFAGAALGEPGLLRYRRADVDEVARFARDGDVIWLDAGGVVAAYVDVSYAPAVALGAASTGEVHARSDGKVVRVPAVVGDLVEKGQVLVVIESMKMELELLAPAAGKVRAVHVAPGDQVQQRRLLVEVEITASS